MPDARHRSLLPPSSRSVLLPRHVALTTLSTIVTMVVACGASPAWVPVSYSDPSSPEPSTPSPLSSAAGMPGGPGGSAGTAPPGATYVAHAALVWVQLDASKPAISTRWIEEKTGVAELVKEVSATVLATEDALWMIQRHDTTGPSCPCKGVFGSQHPDPWKFSELKAVNLATRKERSLAVARPEPAACTGDLERYEAAIVLEGVIGSMVLFGTQSWGMGCGAPHPSHTDTTTVLDLTSSVTGQPRPASLPSSAGVSGSAATLAPPVDARAGLMVEAGALFDKQFHDCVSDPSEAPSHFSTRVRFDASGDLLARYTFTKSAPYSCGSGPGHTSVAADVDTTSVPDALVRWKHAPTWLARYLASERATILGVSPLSAKLDHAAVHAQMSRAKPLHRY